MTVTRFLGSSSSGASVSCEQMAQIFVASLTNSVLRGVHGDGTDASACGE